MSEFATDLVPRPLKVVLTDDPLLFQDWHLNICPSLQAPAEQCQETTDGYRYVLFENMKSRPVLKDSVELTSVDNGELSSLVTNMLDRVEYDALAPLLKVWAGKLVRGGRLVVSFSDISNAILHSVDPETIAREFQGKTPLAVKLVKKLAEGSGLSYIYSTCDDAYKCYVIFEKELVNAKG